MEYQIVAPRTGDLDSLLSKPPLPAFSPFTTDFIDAVSKRILKTPTFQQHTELISLAFWMRQSHIKQLKKRYESLSTESIKLARGLAFHIAPSNVDTIFIYSFFLSMLAGNSNVIRVSSKDSIQLSLLIELINELFNEEQFVEIRARTLIVRYEHSEAITEQLSSACDIRVIWGGDATIKSIRQTPIPATATELTFANKFSLSIISIDTFLDSRNQDELVHEFYNDAFWFDQMACSSPRLIFWYGNISRLADAQQLFWDKLLQKSHEKAYSVSAADSMNKLVAQYEAALMSKVTIHTMPDNLISRLQLSSLSELPMDQHCGAGLFYEYASNELSSLLPIMSRKIQTIGNYGVDKDELRNFIISNQVRGVDRIVPIGKALDFSEIWDGYDLLQQFSRIITID